MNIQFFNFEILEVSQEQRPMPANVRQVSGTQNVRQLNRQELATMSNLDKRLKGSRTGPQSLLDKHEAKKNAQAKHKYKTGAIEEEYEVGQDLGAGQFAVVKRVRHRKTGKFYAAKYIRKRKMKTSRRGVPQEEIEKEIAVLQDLGKLLLNLKKLK
jgi:serine/threonine protein kinase